MKEIKRPSTWMAEDGTEFDDQAACLEYERDISCEQDWRKHLETIDGEIETFLAIAYGDNRDRYKGQIYEAIRKWERNRFFKFWHESRKREEKDVAA